MIDDLEMGQLLASGDVSAAACGKRVRLVRNLAGDTLEEFAPKIGMKPKALQSIETGKAYLRPKYADQIWRQFGVDFNFIYAGSCETLTVQKVRELLDAARRRA